MKTIDFKQRLINTNKKGIPYVSLSTNLPNIKGYIVFYDSTALKIKFQWSTGALIFLPKFYLYEIGKVVFFPLNSAGLWVNNGFEYSESLTALTFQSPPGETPINTHKISGQCLKDGAPFAGTVHVVSALDNTHLTTTQANPATGQWLAEISTSGAVYAFVADNYGRRFAPNLSVTVGDIIHPSASNGHIYNVVESGFLSEAEPNTWQKNGSFANGTALLSATAYPAPAIHGPINPVLI